jgi:hypothetical protein
VVSFGAVAAMAKALADLQKKDAPGTRLLFAEVGVPNLFRARTDEFFFFYDARRERCTPCPSEWLTLLWYTWDTSRQSGVLHGLHWWVKSKGRRATATR